MNKYSNSCSITRDCKDKNNACVFYADLKNTSKLQGNFMSYMKINKKNGFYNKVNIYRLISRINDGQQIDEKKENTILHNKSTLGYNCVPHEGVEISGSYKSGFILKPIKPGLLYTKKSYVVLNFYIEDTSRQVVNKSLNNYYREVVNQIYIHTHYKTLVPKMISVNIFKGKFSDDAKDAGEHYLIQKLEENANVDNFEFINSDDALFVKKISFKELVPVNLSDAARSDTRLIESPLQMFLKDRNIVKVFGDFTDKYANVSDADLKLETLFTLFGDSTKTIDTLEKWWSNSEVQYFCNGFFKSINKLHKINMFHSDISEKNVLYKKINGTEYDFKLIDFGFSGDINYWLTRTRYHLSNAKFHNLLALYYKVYTYFLNEDTKSEYLAYVSSKNTKPSMELAKNLMLVELCSLNSSFKFRFFAQVLLKGLILSEMIYLPYTSFIRLIKNIDNPDDIIYYHDFVFVPFITNCNDIIKNFIADKYAEYIIGSN